MTPFFIPLWRSRGRQPADKWRFSLRKDAVWSDGVPVTAHDFVYAYHRLLHPGFEEVRGHALSAEQWKPITGTGVAAAVRSRFPAGRGRGAGRGFCPGDWEAGWYGSR
ncbi:MAG: ABC transporter substrate-binding protein [Akkermansia muciniphila]